MAQHHDLRGARSLNDVQIGPFRKIPKLRNVRALGPIT
jgi:hypothetical protein